MRKRLSILLSIIFIMILSFSFVLVGCEDPIVPKKEYSPITLKRSLVTDINEISNAIGNVSFYATEGQNLHVHIYFDNKDNLQIKSYKLNGEKKEVAQQENNSKIIVNFNAEFSNDNILLIVNDIEYLAGDESKVLSDNIVHKILKKKQEPKYIVSPDSISVTNSQVLMKGKFIDDERTIIADTKEIRVYKDSKLYKKQKLDSDDIFVKGLHINTNYRFDIVVSINLNDGQGNKEIILFTTYLQTKDLLRVTIDNKDIDKHSVSYKIELLDNDGIGNRIPTLVELYIGDMLIKTLDPKGVSIDKLLADTEYTIKVSYEYHIDLEKMVVKKQASFKTGNYPIPTLSLDAVSLNREVSYKIEKEDAFSLLTINYIKLINKASGKEVHNFNNSLVGELNILNTNTQYELKVSYTYDLKNGGTVGELFSSYSFSTVAYPSPTITINDINNHYHSINVRLSEKDELALIKSYTISLLSGTTVIKQVSEMEYEFINLNSDSQYVIKLVYVYNLQDGEGDKTVEKTEIVKTLNYAIPNATIMNIKNNLYNISGEIFISDSDNIVTKRTLAIKQGANKIAEINLLKETFDFADLTYNTSYMLHLTVEYDLKNGQEKQLLTYTFACATRDYMLPKVSLDNISNDHKSIEGSINISDADKLVKGYKIYIKSSDNFYKDEISYSFESNGSLQRAFTFANLSNNKQFILYGEITYYKKNDGNPFVEKSKEHNVFTSEVHDIILKLESQTDFSAVNLKLTESNPNDLDYTLISLRIGGANYDKNFSSDELNTFKNNKSISISELYSNTSYEAKLTYSYFGKTAVSTFTFRTLERMSPTIEFTDFIINANTVSVNLLFTDLGNVVVSGKPTVELRYFDNGEWKLFKSELFENKTINFENLYFGTSFKLTCQIKYDLTDSLNSSKNIVIEKEFNIDIKKTPRIFFDNFAIFNDGAKYELSVDDVDNVSKLLNINLYQNNVLKAKYPADKTEIRDLLSNTEYKVELVYSVNLSDGKNPKEYKIEKMFTTNSNNQPTINFKEVVNGTKIIKFKLEIFDIDRLAIISKVELFTSKGILIYSLTNINNLGENTLENVVGGDTYTLKLTYKYNLNEGIGEEVAVSEYNIFAPYYIANESDLLKMNDYLTSNIELVNDVILNNTQIKGFGTLEKPFSGVFNGNNFTISRFIIRETTQNYAGLFNYSVGVIKNLNIKNASFSINTISSGLYVGTIVGHNKGVVINCKAEGTIFEFGSQKSVVLGGLVGYNEGELTISQSKNSTIKVTVQGTDFLIGGAVGQNKGKIVNVSVESLNMNSSIKGESRGYFGGLVGYNIANIENSNAESTAIFTFVDNRPFETIRDKNSMFGGGLIGYNKGNIENCFAKINLTLGGLTESFGGGFVGYHEQGEIIDCMSYGKVVVSDFSRLSYAGGFIGTLMSGKVLRCYSLAEVRALTIAGGFVADNKGVISHSFATGNVYGDSFVGALVGFNKGIIDNSYIYGGQIIYHGVGNDIGSKMSIGNLKDRKFFTDILKFSDGAWDLNFMNNLKFPSIGNDNALPSSLPVGSPDSPLLIYTAQELKLLNTHTYYYVKLMKNIDMTGVEWEPIGTEETPYNGVFDGNGYYIENLTITESAKYSGLFAVNGGLIINCKIIDIEINFVNNGTEPIYVGALVAYNKGNIENSGAVGKIKISTINSESYIGGLVGHNYGIKVGESGDSTIITVGNIIDSYSHCDLETLVSKEKKSVLGGFVAINEYGVNTNCYATGNVVADIVYKDDASLNLGGENMFNDNSFTGGFVGINDKSTISNSFATGNISGGKKMGGFIAFGENVSVIKNCYSYEGQEFGRGIPNNLTQMATFNNISSVSFYSSDLGWNIKIWDLQRSVMNSATQYFPIHFGDKLEKIMPSSSEGGIGNPLIIKNREQLITLQNSHNKYIILGADINLNGGEWSPVGSRYNPYNGIFDGNGYSISNFKISKNYDNSIGFFGVVSGDVKNLTIKDFTITGELNEENNQTVSNSDLKFAENINSKVIAGGICGELNGGTIQNCSVENATIKNVAYAGGLVGKADKANIRNSYSTGNITALKNVGGLVGYGYYANINNCYSLASVSCVGDTYSSVGGLIGEMYSGELKNSFVSGTIRADLAKINRIVGAKDLAKIENVLTYENQRLLNYSDTNPRFDRVDYDKVKIAEINTQTFFRDKLKFDNLYWDMSYLDFSNNKLPILKKVSIKEFW